MVKRKNQNANLLRMNEQLFTLNFHHKETNGIEVSSEKSKVMLNSAKSNSLIGGYPVVNTWEQSKDIGKYMEGQNQFSNSIQTLYKTPVVSILRYRRQM